MNVQPNSLPAPNEGTLKIACVIHSLNGGGAERVMAGLASRLSERNHDVMLITLDDASRDKHAVSAAVQRIPLDTMGTSCNPLQAISNNLRRRNRLRQAIQAAQPEVVLSFCDRTNVLTLMASAPLGVPVVVAERSDPRYHPIGRGWHWLRRHYYPRAAKVIVLTTTSARAVGTWHSEPAAVIPSAVDFPFDSKDFDSADAPDPGERKVILGVGRLAWEKGFDRLITAFATLAPRHPEWELRIVGEGPMRADLQKQIEEAGLEGQATLLGWQRDIDACYRRADLFALSSRYEGFPSALLEAMATGVACVAIDCESGPREILHSGIDGVLVPEGNVSVLSDELERLMNDPARRIQLGRSARQAVQRFSWDVMVDAYEEVLRDAAAFSSAALGRR